MQKLHGPWPWENRRHIPVELSRSGPLELWDPWPAAGCERSTFPAGRKGLCAQGGCRACTRRHVYDGLWPPAVMEPWGRSNSLHLSEARSKAPAVSSAQRAESSTWFIRAPRWVPEKCYPSNHCVIVFFCLNALHKKLQAWAELLKDSYSQNKTLQIRKGSPRMQSPQVAAWPQEL